MYVSIIIPLEAININVQNFNFPIGFYTPLNPQKYGFDPLYHKSDQLETHIYNSTKFQEILSSSSWDLPWTRSCRKERKENNNNNNKKRSKNNKSPNNVWET